MKHLTLIAAAFLAACASSTAVSNAPNLQPASLSALPPDAPFRDEILRFAEQDRETPPPACPVLFVGSSSIRMWSSLEADMAPLPVLNRGFGGSRISEVNLYFDRIVTPYRPRAIVFYAGENDLDAGESPDAVAAQFPPIPRIEAGNGSETRRCSTSRRNRRSCGSRSWIARRS